MKYFLIIALFLIPFSSYAAIYSEDFDDEAIGTGASSFGFTTSFGTGVSAWTSTSSQFYSTPYSLGSAPTPASASGVRYLFGTSTQGIFSVQARLDIDNNFEQGFWRLERNGVDLDELSVFARRISPSSYEIICGQNQDETIGTFTVNTWFEVLIQWEQVSTSTQARCGYRTASSLTWSGWKGTGLGYGSPTHVEMSTNASFPSFYVDNWYIDSEFVEPVSPLSTRFVSASANPKGFATTTSSVNFEVDYFVNSDYLDDWPDGAEICIELINYSTMSSFNTPTSPACQDVVFYDELRTFTASQTGFTSVNLYGWRAFLQPSGDIDGLPLTLGEDLIYDNWHQWAIDAIPEGDWQYWGGYGTTSTTTFAEATFECDPDSGDFARSVCNIFVTLFIPTGNAQSDFAQLQYEMNRRIPFSYFFDFKTMLEELPTDAQETPTLTIEAWDNVEVEILSSTTMSQFYPDETRQFLRGIMEMGVWVLVGFAIWNMRTQIFN